MDGNRTRRVAYSPAAEAIFAAIRNDARALAEVLSARRNRWLAGAIFAPASALYLVLLPASYTGGIIGLASLGQLTPGLAAFALLLAALLALTLAAGAHAARLGSSGRRAMVGAGAVLGSVAPAILCCSPAIPTVLALLGASGPQLFGLSGRMQAILAIYQTEILGAAAGLLALALHLNLRMLRRGCRIPAR